MQHLHPAFMITLMKALLTGLATKLPQGITQLSLGGIQVAVSVILSEIQEFLGIYEAVPATHSAYKKALAARKDKGPSAEKLVNALHAALLTVVGPNNEDLKLFGFRPVKSRPPLTTVQLMKAKEKAARTRAARHTLGKRQKAQIHGDEPQPTPKA